MDNATGSGAGVGGLAAVVPWRLCSGLRQPFSTDLSPCISLSKRWQFRGLYAQFWELAGREKDRLYELAGYMAGAGEQLGLACLADHEFSLWESVDLSSAQSHEKVAAEMARRALAELESYYVIGVGHALANMTGRVLALDPDLKQHLAAAKYIETTFTPLSGARQDWLSMNSKVARALQKVAAKSAMPSFVHLADPAAELAGGDKWRALDEVRGEHFHRWRSQSIGMTGAPKSSPWSPDSSTMSVGAGRLIGQNPGDATAADVRQAVVAAREALRSAAQDFDLQIRPALREVVGLELGDDELVSGALLYAVSACKPAAFRLCRNPASGAMRVLESVYLRIRQLVFRHPAVPNPAQANIRSSQAPRVSTLDEAHIRAHP